MKLTLLTREQKAREVVRKWAEAYPLCHKRTFGGGRTNVDIHRDLVALGPTPNPDDVDRVIGNNSWTNPGTCDSCDLADKGPRIMLGQEPDYGSCTAIVCESCLREALAMLAT